MPNFLELFKSAKTRNLLIVLGFFFVVVALFAIYLMKSGGPSSTAGAKLSQVPKTVEFESGAKNLSQEYLKTLMQSEQLKYQQAVQTGGSSIPTFVRTDDQGQRTGSLFSATDETCPPSCYEMLNKRYAQYKTPENLLTKWVKDGRLLPSTAADLNKLDQQSKSESEYAAALNQLVKEGKLTPEQARQLLEAYRKEHHLLNPQISPTDDLIDQLVGQGKLTPEDAANLRRLVDQGVSVPQFKGAVDTLVNNNRLAQDPANQLLNAYEKQKAAQEGRSPLSKVESLLESLKKQGMISPEVADNLKALEETPVSTDDFGKALNRFVNEKKLNSGIAAQLLDVYRSEHPDQTAQTPKDALSQFQKEQQERERQQREEEARREAQARTEEEREQQASVAAATLKTVQASMTTQITSLISAWNPSPQKYVFAPIKKEQKATSQVVVGPDGRIYTGGAAGQVPIIKSGSILFGVLDTGINSDQAGPIMATIVNGPYKGAKLIGGLKQTTDGERVTLTFTQMTMPDWADVITINAVAINPDTAQTALASSVDHHYISRYGTLFASSFISGLAKAVQQSGSTNVTSDNNTTTTYPKLNTRQQVYMALGEVGQKFGDVTKDRFNRKPTVKVSAGIGIGILFTDSVYKIPLVQTGSKAKSVQKETQEETQEE